MSAVKNVKPKVSEEKKKKIILTSVCVFVGIIVLIWFWLTFLYNYITVDDAYIDREKATISSKIIGRINKILVNEGENVRKDQILIQLDNAELLAQKKQAEISLDIARGNVDLAKLKLDKLEDDFKRITAIYKSNNVSFEQYIHSKNDYESALESYKISQRQFDVASAQMELIYANINNTIINSMFNGIVSKKWLTDGEVVQPGQPILSINNTDTLWLIANVEETNISNININKEVKITIDAYPGKKFKGKVIQIGASTASQFSLIPANNASGNFTKITQRIPVKISVELVDKKDNINKYSLAPGMSAIVKFKKR